MKKEMKMQVGTLIKSFDFPGSTDCYMIGSITAIDGDFIFCDTIKQVFDGKPCEMEEFNKTFRTVKQGCSFGDQKFQRIVVLG